MSVPLLLAPGQDFPERDLLIFIAAGVILLSLVAACIALPLLLRGVENSPDEKRHKEVREAWKKTAVAAIHALEADEPAEADTPDAAQAALATELKARLMSEYRHQLEVFNDSAEAQALAQQMAAFSAPALAAIKDCVNRAWESSLTEGVWFERQQLYARFATHDAPEGLKAFVDKRKPVFRHA